MDETNNTERGWGNKRAVPLCDSCNQKTIGVACWVVPRFSSLPGAFLCFLSAHGQSQRAYRTFSFFEESPRNEQSAAKQDLIQDETWAHGSCFVCGGRLTDSELCLFLDETSLPSAGESKPRIFRCGREYVITSISIEVQ